MRDMTPSERLWDATIGRFLSVALFVGFVLGALFGVRALLAVLL